MKTAQFNYHAPATVDEAIDLLSRYGDDAKLIAGGQSLVPMMALRLARFDHLIDLNRIMDLQQIASDNVTLSIGALTRQATVERSDLVASTVPLLARAVPLIGHFQIRNRATIGGSIAHADPASELPAVALSLDAAIELQGPRGIRSVPAKDFFISVWQSAAEPDEIITRVLFPIWGSRSGFAIEEFALRSGDFAIAGAVCAVGLDVSGSVDRAAIAFMGMGSTPVRATHAEQLLLGHGTDSLDLDRIVDEAVNSTDPPNDIHASSNYRRSVATHLTLSALRSAIEEAAGV